MFYLFTNSFNNSKKDLLLSNNTDNNDYQLWTAYCVPFPLHTAEELGLREAGWLAQGHTAGVQIQACPLPALLWVTIKLFKVSPYSGRFRCSCYELFPLTLPSLPPGALALPSSASYLLCDVGQVPSSLGVISSSAKCGDWLGDSQTSLLL